MRLGCADGSSSGITTIQVDHVTCAKASGPQSLKEQAGCRAPLFSLSSAEAFLISCGFDPVPGMCRRQMELDLMVIPRACDMSMSTSCIHMPARSGMYE